MSHFFKMDNNIIIKNNLLESRDKHLKKIDAFNGMNILIRELMDELVKFNFNAYIVRIKDEITYNLQEFWTNIEKGILREEELYAILFEFDGFSYTKNVKALAYGIGKYNNYQVQTDVFDMGFKYGFTSNFYAHPGLTLDFFDGLEKIAHAGVWEKHDDILFGRIELDEAEKLDELEKFDQLDDLIDEVKCLYELEGFIAIHQALKELNDKGIFEKLNYKNNFMFLVQRHDTRNTYPLLIK